MGKRRPRGSLLLAAVIALAALPISPASADPPLFSSDALLEITLTIDFDRLCRPRETEDCDFESTSLRYRDDGGEWRSLPVGVRVRGGWRSLTRHCSAPLLWVRFDGASTSGSPFEGQSMLPLTTHCGRGLSLENATRRTTRAEFEQYLLREYLGHRLYQRVTDFSIGARLVRIAYSDPGGRNRPDTHYAFFTEHFGDVAARTGSEWLPRGNFDAALLDPQASATLALFQFMVGNTDWSIARERNTALFLKDGRQIPVPYDLDMSGLVDADYAGPAPGLPISDVRQRYFLGYCQPGTDWNSAFALYSGKQQSMLDLVGEIPGLSRKSRRSVTRFLEEFFEIIARREDREGCIVSHCQPWPPAEERPTSRTGTR